MYEERKAERPNIRISYANIDLGVVQKEKLFVTLIFVEQRGLLITATEFRFVITMNIEFELFSVTTHKKDLEFFKLLQVVSPFEIIFLSNHPNPQILNLN